MHGVVYIVWDGVVTWDDWSKQLSKLMTDPNWRKASLFIADTRSVTDTSSIELEHVTRAMALLGTDREAVKHKRGAIIASNTFGKAKHFAYQVAMYGVRVVVFNNIDTACLFLGLDVVETSRVLEGLRRRLRGE